MAHRHSLTPILAPSITPKFQRPSRPLAATYDDASDRQLIYHSVIQGRTTGGEAPPPLGPEKHYVFRVSSVKLRDLHL